MVFQERGEQEGEGEGRPANGQLCGVAKEGESTFEKLGPRFLLPLGRFGNSFPTKREKNILYCYIVLSFVFYIVAPCYLFQNMSRKI